MSYYPITWITDSLAVGYAPTSYAELDSIKARGVDAVVNLCAEFSDLHEIEASSGFEVFYLPIWDEDVPAMDDMENALAWLDEAIYLGKKVLVHCRHGIGRTGTFVTSYMIRKGMGLKDAKKKLKSSRANPTNYCQWKLLKKYTRQSGTLSIREPSLESKNRVDLTPFFSDYQSLINDIDTELLNHTKEESLSCGKGEHSCCSEPFDLQFIEAVYLHATMNRRVKSADRAHLIQRAVEVNGKKRVLCPLNDGTGCQVFDFRPARCRFHGIPEFSPGRHEIRNILRTLSRTIFLAFSGEFLPDTEFTFSVADAVSGKFVQKYFNYMAGMKK